MSWDDRVDNMIEEQFPEPSKRAYDWREFALKVEGHIEDYTVPQYGDKGVDQCTDYDERDFKKQINKYANRLDSNMRGTVEAKRDLLKICHYAQMLHDLIEE